MRPWLTDKKRAEFAEIFDCAPHEVDARLNEQTGGKTFIALCIEQSGLMVEGITATVALGAVNLADELARRSVEGFPLKPTCDENGNWSSVPAHEVDGADKRVLRAAVAVALGQGAV